MCVSVFCARVCVCVCPGKYPYQYEMGEGEGFYLLCFKTWWSARHMILRVGEKLPALVEHLDLRKAIYCKVVDWNVEEMLLRSFQHQVRSSFWLR